MKHTVVIMIAPAKFNIKPSFAMLVSLNLLVENTIVFGAVATGSMKAQLALIAAGTIISSGFISADKARAANIGRMREVVARLLVISVRNVISRQIARISTKMCQLEIYESD